LVVDLEKCVEDAREDGRGENLELEEHSTCGIFYSKSG